MLSLLKHLLSPWTWSMAWRDSRSIKAKLILFSSAIVFGVAALVTIGSLRQSLEESVNTEAKSLLGADFMLSCRHEFTPKANQLKQALGGEHSDEISVSSMISINGETKLAAIRGLSSGFPFYGGVPTTPTEAWSNIQQKPGVLLEESFLKSLGAEVGDTVEFSNVKLPILGVMKQVPPSAAQFSGILPTVVVSLSELKKTSLFSSKSLFGFKSMATHRTYFKIDPKTAPDQLLKKHRKTITEERLSSVTTKKRSEMLQEAIGNLSKFFNLISFSALFLGGIGIASAMHVHISERLKSVATLRCLGCSVSKAFAVYLCQGVAMGIIGTLMGLTVGVGLLTIANQFLPQFAHLIPFEITLQVSLQETFKAAFIGIAISIGFTLLPLLAVRNVSPLSALRNDQSVSRKASKDPYRWFIIISLATLALLLAWLDSREWTVALAYIGFLAFAFITLLLTGKCLIWTIKKATLPSLPFVLRQGASALKRPNNQTSIFMVSIGLGVFFIFTLLFMQNILTQWLAPDRLSEKANVILIDVAPDKSKAVEQVIKAQGVTPLDNSPIIQMRLKTVNGVAAEKLVGAKRGEGIPKWMLNRDFRSSSRSYLNDSESIISGEWIKQWTPSSPNEPIPISVAKSTVDQLKIQLGDTLSFNVQGKSEEILTVVKSIRSVNWSSMGINFLILFPEKSVDQHIAFNLITANSPDSKTTAKLQKAVYQQWPTVNTMDIGAILTIVQSVLSTSVAIIQAMASFTVLTGAIVLVASILAGNRARVKEAVLLRTLGASQSQISRILAVEYTLLASIATATGALLATLACLLLGALVFQGESFHFPWITLTTASLFIVITTVLLGLLLSRSVSKVSPLKSIRHGS